MKLLHLANNFAPSSQALLSAPASVEKPTDPRSQHQIRYTPVVLIILLVFAGFSLTVPLHPSRSTGSDSCSNVTVLAAGNPVSDCPDLATVSTTYNAVVKSISNLAGSTKPGSHPSLSEADNPDPSRNVTLTGRVLTAKHYS